MINKNLQENFYTQIETALSFCDGNVTTLVFYNFSNLKLRKALIETIATTCLSRKISISSAIVEVERLYSVNSID